MQDNDLENGESKENTLRDDFVFSIINKVRQLKCTKNELKLADDSNNVLSVMTLTGNQFWRERRSFETKSYVTAHICWLDIFIVI